MELQGLCDILGGKYTEIQPPDPLSPSLNYPGGLGACDPAGWENKHIKLPAVTAIFPSITFASWASIYTGKLPNETGILGQEFFARDLIRSNDMRLAEVARPEQPFNVLLTFPRLPN